MKYNKNIFIERKRLTDYANHPANTALKKNRKLLFLLCLCCFNEGMKRKKCFCIHLAYIQLWIKLGVSYTIYLLQGICHPCTFSLFFSALECKFYVPVMADGEYMNFSLSFSHSASAAVCQISWSNLLVCTFYRNIPHNLSSYSSFATERWSVNLILYAL